MKYIIKVAVCVAASIVVWTLWSHEFHVCSVIFFLLMFKTSVEKKL